MLPIEDNADAIDFGTFFIASHFDKNVHLVPIYEAFHSLKITKHPCVVLLSSYHLLLLILNPFEISLHLVDE